MAQKYFAVTIIALLAVSQGVSAKRGCSAFGHSCFGGHGKRSGDSSMEQLSSQDLVARRQLGQEETPPHPVYPHSSYSGVLPAGDDMIPVRDGGVYDRDDPSARDAVKMKLRSIFQRWMDNYRLSEAQQNRDDGYYIETL